MTYFTPGKYMWLSFATESHFRGAAIVEGNEIIECTKKTHALGINPGGQVLGAQIPTEAEHLIPIKLIEKLLNREEAQFITKIFDDFTSETKEKQKMDT